MKNRAKFILLSFVGGILIALGLISKNAAMAILAAISGVHLTVWAYMSNLLEKQ